MEEFHSKNILWFNEIGLKHIPLVGGKNASLGEMIHHFKKKGILIPNGFATTSKAYWQFIRDNKIEEPIQEVLEKFKSGNLKLEQAGAQIRALIQNGNIPVSIADNIIESYHKLGEQYSSQNIDVAVRSSATAEDLPHASFAGLQETYLNVSGPDELIEACKNCFASLFTNRAISYREEKNFDHMKVALSVGVQKMVRANESCSGVMFTVDTETGFPHPVIVRTSDFKTNEYAQLIGGSGLKRGENDLEVYVMCEIPSNYILVEEFSEFFDGFSIGSNDLTQLILGVDRDSAELAYLFDENDPAVKKAIRSVIKRAHRQKRKVGFCGQAPSDDPDFAAFLVESEIDSISLNPDSVISTIEKIIHAKKQVPV